MSPAPAVARFTMHAGLGGLETKLRLQSKRSGRVALEAAEDRCARLEGAVSLAFGGLMSRRQCGTLRASVVTEAMLDIVVLIELADESFGLITRSECPLRVNGAIFAGALQRAGVTALLLGRVDVCVARAADLRSHKLRREGQ